MKMNRVFFRRLVISVWLTFYMLIIITSCKKSDDQIIDYEYLVEFERITFLGQASIKAMLNVLSNDYPEAIGLFNNTGYNVEVYRITYKTNYGDSLIEASGLVCIPLAEEPFPVISFQNATTTLHDNAPSTNPFYLDYLLIEGMAGNGYIIIMPDYIGFGASEDITHPYYNRTCTNNAVIDMIKASREFLNNANILASENGNYYLMGYSQGGGSTLSVLDEIENGPEPGFDIIATSCGAGAFYLYDMSEHMLSQETIPSALYLPYFIYAQQEYGALPDDLGIYFREPYASRIPLLFDGTNSGEEINNQLIDTVQKLMTPSFIADFSDGAEFELFRNVLQSNSTNAWNTNSYINFIHGSDDIHVPYTQSADMYEDFIGLGVSTDRVRIIELEGLTHRTSIIPWGIMTVLWFNELEAF